MHVVYVLGGGCIDLVRCPLCGKLEWLKDLSIFEGMLRNFNFIHGRVLDGAHVHTSYVMYVHGGKCTDLVG